MNLSHQTIIIGIIDGRVIALVLTFSSLERNSHIGIAEPVTRIVTQHPSRMQVVTFAIKVPLIIIMLAPLFRLPSVLHDTRFTPQYDYTCSHRCNCRRHGRCRIIDNKLNRSSQDRRLVYTESRSRLPLRFMLLRASSGDHAPPSAPTLSHLSGFRTHVTVRGEQSPRDPERIYAL